MARARRGARRAVTLLPFALLLNGCAVAVIGALGGAGALTYQYANKHDKSATTQADPPASGVNPFDPSYVYSSGIGTEAEAAQRPGSKADPAADPPAPGESPWSSAQIHPFAIGPAAEAAQRPGPTSLPSTAEGNVPSTIAANYPWNQTLNPANPFAIYEVPRPFNGITLNNLQLATSFAAPAQPLNHTVPKPAQ